MPSSDAGASNSPAPPNATADSSSKNDSRHPASTTVDAPASEDAILQSKEQAKAVMTASLKSADSPAPPPSRQPSKTPSNDVSDKLAQASPVGSSRKRSRSGSRLANNPPESKWPSTARLLIDQFTARDQMHSAAMERDQQRAKLLNAEMAEDKVLLERFRARRMQDAQRFPTRVAYPSQRRGWLGRRTPVLRVPGRDRVRQADTLEDLVPIRLDLEFEKLRLRDTFTWNIHDRVVHPRIFAQGLVEDFRMPPEAVEYFTREAYNSLQEQIADFHPHVFSDEDTADPHLPYHAYKNDEMRIQVKLNITIGHHTLVDQFDWDINNPYNSPEAFARQMANDLSLSGEFMTAIAHCIREQSQLYTKGLYVAAHPFDGRPVEDSDIRENLLPSPIPSAYRPFQSAKEHAPYFYELNEADIERTELAFSREQRQQKRSTNRRGGPSLPDLKERLKTWRTLVVSSVVPGAAESVEKSGIYRVSRSRRKPWNAGRGGDDDDDLSGDSEDDSDPESPVRLQQQFGGTSRTRGMRGAASAATAAMRAINRSVSPEHTQPQETKQMSRRLGAGPVFQEFDDNGVREGLTVKMKVPRERFRQWWREWKRDAPKREAEAQRRLLLLQQQQQQQQQQQMANMRANPQQSATPGPTSAMGPPSTPGMGNRNLPNSSQALSNGQTDMNASPGVHASPNPNSDAISAPPPPAWVTTAINKLRARYPADRFEATMRRSKDPNAADQFVPRIRCGDCPGNVYLVRDDDPELGNFSMHLKNARHVERRQQREKAEAGAG